MKKNPYSTIAVSPSFQVLAKYITEYRRLRGKATIRIVMEQLILSYAKQLASGMPEETWRYNILSLINMCEEEHKELYEKEQRKYQEYKEREARAAAHYRSDPTVL